MPVYTLGDVCSKATLMAGGRADWSLSEASFWANAALEEVARAQGARHKPPETLYQSSTTSGGYRFALPSDFVAPLALTLWVGSNSTNTLSRMTYPVDLIQRTSDWGDSQAYRYLGGIPENYVPWGTFFELVPSPNSAYSMDLRYVASQSELTLSTSTPTLTAQWSQAWLYKTVEKLEASRSNPNGEAVARNRYINYVNTLDTDLAAMQKDKRSMAMRFGGQRNLNGPYGW